MYIRSSKVRNRGGLLSQHRRVSSIVHQNISAPFFLHHNDDGDDDKRREHIVHDDNVSYGIIAIIYIRQDDVSRSVAGVAVARLCLTCSAIP